MVVPAPFAVRASRADGVWPDVLVVRDEKSTEVLSPVAPLLVVDVVPPGCAVDDANARKSAYERMGVECYWRVDPVTSLVTVCELDDDGRYGPVTEVAGTEVFDAVRPFPVRIVAGGSARR